MKYTKYILILVILIELFSLTVKVSAQTVLGPCTVTDANRNIIFQERTTEADCKAKRIVGVNTIVWQASSSTTYQLLAPLPGADGNPLKEVNPETGLGSYLNLMIKIFIGLCAVLSVVMIIVGGLEYMTTELISTKEHGKERITQAILGLLIALGAYALLFTINPDLLKSDLEVPDVKVTIPATAHCSDAEFTTKEACEGANNPDIKWIPS